MLFDTNSLSAFRDDGLGTYFWSENVDQLDFYFVYGPELVEVVGGLRRLTGTPTMLPRWAYGYQQSKERYRTAEELLQVAGEYRRRKLDVRMMISVWPAMRGEQNENLKEMRARGHVLPDGATYNAFSPEARAQYWEHAEKGLFSSGLDAWWCDCTEPFQGDWFGHMKMEPAARIRAQVDKFKQNLDPGLINAYSLKHSQGIYEGQRGSGSTKRVVNLTRSGYPGQHRYGTITWSGDIEATWKRLRQQIADGLNFTATGNPRWTLDIGAFFAAPREEWFRAGEYPDRCDDPGYRELYTRWFQYAAFLPMFRSHGTDTPREVWRFGEPGTIYYDTLKEFLELRYRLLPYIYSCAAAETLDDETLYRMLAFDFRADPRSHNVADQFLFGPALMVCPVTEAMEYGPRGAPIAGHSMTRPVYLPAGCRWHDFWTGAIREGGQQIEAPAPIRQIPIYIRGGSIVPMGPVVQHAGEALDAPWDLRIHSGADGVFVMYEDACDGWDYEAGAYARTTMRWDDRARMLTIDRREGKFDGLVKQRTVRVWLDGVKGDEIVYAGDEVSVHVFRVQSVVMKPRPNVLWLMSDQHNANCTGYRGHPNVKTPNLDRIAASGVDFTHAYANNPICAPSRTCFMTGEYMHTHRFFGNYNFAYPEAKHEHLGYVFRMHGYQTALIGKSHMVGRWDRDGFEHLRYCDLMDSDRRDPMTNHYFRYLSERGLADRYEEGTPKPGQEYTMDGSGPAHLPYEHSIERFTGNESLAFIEGRDRSRPFFLQMSFQRPHAPIAPSAEHFDTYDPDEIELPDSAVDWLENDFAGKPAVLRDRLLRGSTYPLADKDPARLKRVLASYYALITVIDSEIGRVMAYLEESGQLENTVVLYTADHGDFAGEHGLFHKNFGLYESITKIPFLLSWPGGPRGVRDWELTESVDLFPTLCSLCDVPAPAGREGLDLTKRHAAGSPGGRSAGVGENTSIAVTKDAAYSEWEWGGKDISAVRTKEYRLVYYRGEGEGELYDHRSDPGELHNLWSDPEHAAVRHELLMRLLDFTLGYQKRSDSESDRREKDADRHTPGELVQFGGVYWNDLERAYQTRRRWE